MRKWLARWLLRKELIAASRDEIHVEEAVAKAQPKIRIGQVDAINGKLLEVATFKRNQHGPDWTSEYFIIDPTQTLAEQIATVLVMKGMSV